jgi:hypothetical protein
MFFGETFGDGGFKNTAEFDFSGECADEEILKIEFRVFKKYF